MRRELNLGDIAGPDIEVSICLNDEGVALLTISNEGGPKAILAESQVVRLLELMKSFRGLDTDFSLLEEASQS